MNLDALNIFSRQRRLFLVLSVSLLAAVCLGCGPHHLRKDASGVYLLPAPKFSPIPGQAADPVVGNKYLGDIWQASDSRIARVYHFLPDGKLVSQNVSYPEIRPRNDFDQFGFYTITQMEVSTAIYAIDSGIPGYRYYYGKFSIDTDGNLVTDNGVVYTPIGEATEPAWEWRLEE